MFATLSYNPGEEEPLRIKRTQDPALVAFGQGPHHIACNRCRAKKLRCDSVRTGCARCKAKSIACVYPGPNEIRGSKSARGESGLSGLPNGLSGRSKPKTPVLAPSSERSEPMEHNGSALLGTTGQAPDSVSPDRDSSHWGMHSLGAGMADLEGHEWPMSSTLADFMLDDCLLFGQAAAEDGRGGDTNTASSSDDRTVHDPNYIEPSPSCVVARATPPALPTPPLQTPPLQGPSEWLQQASLGLSQAFGMSELDSGAPGPILFSTMSTPTGHDMPATPSAPLPPMVTGECTRKALQYLEDLAVKNNHRHQASAVYSLAGILSSQKRALSGCDAILNCTQCSLSEGMFVLLYMISEALVVSFERLSDMDPSQQRSDSWKQSLDMLTGAATTGLASPAEIDLEVVQSPTVPSICGSSSGSGSVSVNGSGVGGCQKRPRTFLGEYEIESGQEWNEVLRMLAKLQLNGLGRLVKRLREAASMGQCAHRLSLVVALEQRLRTILARRCTGGGLDE